MPDFWSHHIAAQKAYTRYLQFKDSKPSFEGDLMKDYCFGAQGPDFYYYIHQINPFSKRHYSALGTHFHHHDVHRTLELLIDCAIESTHPPIRAYVAGYLTHYILDAECHPHICSHAPEPRAHKVYELALDALCVTYYEQVPIHTLTVTPYKNHATAYLKHLWSPILHSLSINSSILSKDFDSAYDDMFVIQKVLLSDLIGKNPWVQNFSKLFKYDLSQLMYPNHFTETDLKSLKFDAFNIHFNQGIEQSSTMLKKLDDLYAEDLSKEAFLKWLVKGDYLGNPIKNGGK
ncbi:zinc dependent phospholipase C family protein [Fusibacter ferrireducens]|uniref:Zinc dependent phospholipase C family protein n=1 Tax=Fusibacter ferrireducens TaxID=2785058 RepID=A0ABR9ZTJ9_9FIRM|nr:zinc dependent phospholipase C family protein [Fusibacter ferrireducens]MBF4693286.1 zinc dependent phospholipase C family protein [Fusibacter ferrireducens]